MDINALKTSRITTPAFIIDENVIVEALESLAALRLASGCKILYSIKSLPLTSVLELAQPYVDGFSVSSLFEARIAAQTLSGTGSIHLTTPGLNPKELNELAERCSHISLNSLTQYERFAKQINTSVGLRVNPKLSFVTDDRYNPCRQFSKLGTDIDLLWQSSYLEQLRGLHVHNNFASTDYQPLIETVEKIERYLGKNMHNLNWLNLGGGYLFNEINNQKPFIEIVKHLTDTYGITVYIEPGKAIVGRSGYLLSSVIDSFICDGKNIAILDTSVNHQPEVFEYQVQPELHEHYTEANYPYLLAGNTCLAGDLFGDYSFQHPLAIGDQIVFKNLGAYSLIKANRFNGYNLPDIYSYRNGVLKQIKEYSYQDFNSQWSTD